MSEALLKNFYTAILANESNLVVEDIKPHPRLSKEQLFKMYSHGYRIRLVQVMRSDYPALLSEMGDKDFDALALRYVESTPSLSYNLDTYPHGFAAFCEAQLQDAFLVEIAALEGAIAQVFVMHDSEPLSVNALVGVSMETFSAMKLRPRIASKLMKFTYPVSDWLSAQRAGGNPAKPNNLQSYVLVYRHENEVKRISMQAAAYCILQKLSLGECVGDVLEHVLAENPIYADMISAGLQGWFNDWVSNGVFRSAID